MQQEFSETATIYPPPEPLNLFTASQQGNLEFIKQNLNDPNVQDTEQTTLLHWSSINNHTSISSYLIQKGALVDARGGALNATPLHWASRSGHIPTCVLLLSHSADPQLKDGQGYNCLHLAAHAGHSFLILYLLSMGMDVDERDAGGRSALHWVSYNGTSIESLEVLLGSGANVDAVDDSGFTAIHWAVVASHWDVVKVLIGAGCDLHVKDAQGKTARDWAVERDSEGEFVKVLDAVHKEKKPLPFSKVASV